jgi:hypothetical protein
MGEGTGSAGRTRPGLRGAFFALAAAAFFGMPFLAPDAAFPSVRAAETVGDCNFDGGFDLSDAVFLLVYLFEGGEVPACQATCDFRADGALELTDAIGMAGYLFQGEEGPAPLVEGACDGSIGIEWDPVTVDVAGHQEAVAGYRIYVRERLAEGSLSPRTRIAEAGPACACIDLAPEDLRSLVGGRDYLFSVSAFDASGNESQFSADLAIGL